MRETNLNKAITRTDVKVGDTIRISRDVVVKAVRETTLYAGVGKPRRPITIVDTGKDTVGLTEDESVTLLERDKESEIKIPLTATHIFWQDTEGYDYYARRTDVGAEWVTSVDSNLTFTTPALIKEIENIGGEFDEYQPGTFQVLKNKYASGYAHAGMLSSDSLRSLGGVLRSPLVGSNPFA